MVNHTPGPWRLRRDRSEAPDDFIVMAPKGDSIADCAPGHPYISAHEAGANARLIAAAPDLKDALKWALEALAASDLATWPDANGWDADAYKLGLQQAKDALAKAGAAEVAGG